MFMLGKLTNRHGDIVEFSQAGDGFMLSFIPGDPSRPVAAAVFATFDKATESAAEFLFPEG